MKKLVLFLALGSFGSLFCGESYSMIPVDGSSSSGSFSSSRRLANADTMRFTEEFGERTYVDTRLTKKDILKKSAVVVTEDNVDEVIRTFSDAFIESFRKAGKATESGANEFLQTLYTQQNILGKTAKEVMEIFEDLADQKFPSLAETLFQELRDTKFVETESGLSSIRREEVLNTCCSILRAITYRYLQAQETASVGSDQRAYSYPHYRGASVAMREPSTGERMSGGRTAATTSTTATMTTGDRRQRYLAPSSQQQ